MDWVVFGEDWGAHPSSTQHLLRSALASGTERVIWIDSIGLRRPRLTRHDVGRLWRKLLQTLGALLVRRRTESDADAPAEPQEQWTNLLVLRVLILPFPGVRWLEPINGWLLRRQIEPHMRRMGFRDTNLWVSLPSALPALDTLPHARAVYYCCDDFEHLAGVDHGAVRDLELRLVERADVVLCSSEALCRKLGPASVLLPHGVDTELFATSGECPAPLQSLQGRRIAGFYGSISEWIHIERLAAVATLKPAWEFVLVGHVATDIRPLEGLPNVTLLPPVPHHDLPAYVHRFDAALLPFRDNGQIRACNPLKLREYLAAGVPVISAEFEALEPYLDLVQVAVSAEALGDALDTVAAMPPEGRSALGQRCRERVAEESWDARFRSAKDAVANCKTHN